MKKLIFVSILFVAFISKAQQNPTSKNDVNSVYGSLIYKDVATVMKTLNIKDTVGKTFPASFEQYKKGQKCLVIKRDNGEHMCFFDNLLYVVIPKH